MDDTTSTKPPVARVFHIQKTARSQELRSRLDFVCGKQHDHKDTSWAGKSRTPGMSFLRERLLPLGYQRMSETPYDDRRPACPIPMARQVTARFSDMLLGERRRPMLSTPGDVMTEAYLEAVFDEANLWDTLASVRDSSGGCGSCAVIIGLVDGRPCSTKLETTDIYVKEWAQEERWIPRLAFWQKLVELEVENEETGRLETQRVWKTKAWDETYEYTYEDVPEGYDTQEQRFDGRTSTEIPLAGEPKEHGAGRCPLVWVQNTRNPERPEGEPDNEGVYELADAIDKLASMLMRGAVANVDPTLHIADDIRSQRRAPAPRKGWGHVIRTSEKGKVNLVQITGDSFEVGWKTYERLRQAYLQTVRCVIVDPETAGKYQSGESQSMLWRAMEGACSRKRTPLSDAIRQLAQIGIHLGEVFGVGNTEDPASEGVLLPPMVLTLREAIERGYDEEPTADFSALADGLGLFGTGEDVDRDLELDEVFEQTSVYEHRLGQGRTIEVVWGPFHDPTPTQMREVSTMLGQATGNKQVLSQRTAVGVMVRYLGLGSPEEEYEAIVSEEEKKQERYGAAMFGPEGKADADVNESLDEVEEVDGDEVEAPSEPVAPEEGGDSDTE